MDDQRVGRVVRALRRRLGWRQVDLARAAGCSQAMVSLVERGRLARASLPLLRRLIAALDATLAIEVRWRGAALDRLLDEDHAVLVGRLAELLETLGWLVQVEVSYSEWGERGSYDLLALHPASGTLLVVEVKTDLPAVEAMLRKLDEKARLAAEVAAKRLGWTAAQVARLLVMPDSSTMRRRASRHEAVLARALADRGTAIRRWLANPDRQLAGLWFLSDSGRASLIQRRGGRHRVRRADSSPASADAAA